MPSLARDTRTARRTRSLVLLALIGVAVVALPLRAHTSSPISDREFQVNTAEIYDKASSSVVMLADGDFVVVWRGIGHDPYGPHGSIQAQRYNARREPQGRQFQVKTDAYQLSVAMDADGDFVLVSTSWGQDGNWWGIYAQRYNAHGEPQGGEFRVNTSTISQQVDPSVAMDADGDFVVVWMRGLQDESSRGIYAQRYNAHGEPQGGEFRVNTSTTGWRFYPSVAMDVDGDFVVVWMSPDQDGSSWDIYAQRYNAHGEPQGGEFRVNTSTTGRQRDPSVAMDVDGDFVVVWMSPDQDGSSWDIYAQRYNAHGEPQGGEFRVNTSTIGQQVDPSVAMDADGNFVVVWMRDLQDESSRGIYAQRYNAHGEPQGGEFRVNTSTTGWRFYPSVAMDVDGDFVVTWTSWGQDWRDRGIFARHFPALLRVHLPLVGR